MKTLKLGGNTIGEGGLTALSSCVDKIDNLNIDNCIDFPTEKLNSATFQEGTEQQQVAQAFLNQQNPLFGHLTS